MAKSSPKPSLQYPTNIANGNNDYFHLQIFEYKPLGLGGGGDNLFDVSSSQAQRPKVDKETSGDNQSYLGQIILPMPDNIGDNNSVSWDTDTLNSLTIAGAGTLSDAISKLNFNNPDPGGALDTVKDGASKFLDALKDIDVRGTLKNTLITSAITGGNVDPNSIVSRTTGQVLNPNLELLFKGVILRQFNYSFTLTPRTSEEGTQIKGIINTLKKRMSAKNTTGAAAGIFIKAPDVFQPRFMQGQKLHPFLYSIRQCALVSMNVNYDGAGIYATYGDGTPVKMTLQMSFRELSPLYSEDYKDGLPGPDEGVGF
ncbi:baseplate tail tube cap [Synechococcus phage S-CAM7]|uniref:Baseplate tail tube cap n=1 Tax=Synechococcus phage S-CAM7 TaxID=1883368 RepID=A0A1D8KTI1_9CAUD|nr:baseplate tail tube cap [Synechococcus phage S-CAM7]AOV61929.1 baseplate tail tube cap [Synechococcus phage S-CAM7]